MEKLKSTFTNMALALTLVAVFAGGLLAWVNNMTQGPIKAQEEKTLTDAIGLVMADGSLKVSSTDTVRINHDGDISTYIVHNATDSKGTPLGCAVESSVISSGSFSSTEGSLLFMAHFIRLKDKGLIKINGLRNKEL